MASSLQSFLGMEKQNSEQEEKKIQESLKTLSRELCIQVKARQLYGLDQKIRILQRAFSLATRI